MEVQWQWLSKKPIYVAVLPRCPNNKNKLTRNNYEKSYRNILLY